MMLNHTLFSGLTAIRFKLLGGGSEMRRYRNDIGTEMFCKYYIVILHTKKKSKTSFNINMTFLLINKYECFIKYPVTINCLITIFIKINEQFLNFNRYPNAEICTYQLCRIHMQDKAVHRN